MEKYYDSVLKSLVEIFGANFAKNVKFDFSRTEEKFGDFATNAAMIIFGLAKKDEKIREKLDEIGVKNPRNLAEKIREKLLETGEFESVEIAGPGFLNLKISAKNLAGELQNEFRESEKNALNFGENNSALEIREENGKKIEHRKIAVVEYPSPNVAKPYSVGHLRPGDQGWAAKNLLESQGWKVITDNHLGDSGSPFGYWVIGYKMFSDPEKLAKNGVYELGRVYIKIREELKKEEKSAEKIREESEKNGKIYDEKIAKPLATEAQNWLLKLENHDPEAEEFSRKFNDISLAHIHKVMKRLGISTEYEYGEKFFAPLGKKVVDDAVKNGFATENPDGSVIIDLADEGIKTPFLVRKNNGANLYATGDLACLIWREENWHPDLVVHCVGNEQKFYFEQVAAVARKLKLHEKIYHMANGMIDQMIDGKREKMSSRKGVVLMEELLDFAEKKARENAKTTDMSEEDIAKIAVGAIKFADFSADRRTGMLFDWNTIFSLTGFSGPYVQYAAVRVNKILKDNSGQIRENSDENYDYEAEKNLILKLLEYPEIVKIAAEKLEPHRIANYAFELAKILNKYYESTPVATEKVPPEIREKRLEILAKVADVFKNSLGILGIEIPGKM